jgi:hypothetical protein
MSQSTQRKTPSHPITKPTKRELQSIRKRLADLGWTPQSIANFGEGYTQGRRDGVDDRRHA